jgi:hypothetical protein
MKSLEDMLVWADRTVANIFEQVLDEHFFKMVRLENNPVQQFFYALA